MQLRLLFCLILLCSNLYSQTFEIIITEVFADPTPSKGLPEREFIEIFNPTSKDLRLKGFKLFYGSSSVVFPDSILKSNSYAIVCRKEYIKEFSDYGSVIGLSNFSLSNEGALLVLKNDKSLDVAYVNYAIEWHSKEKEQGYSLEMIDLNFPCRGKENWKSSNSSKGASPGKQNSNNSSNPDIFGPKILAATLDFTQIKILFNENLHAQFFENKNNFKLINGGNSISGIGFDKYLPNELKIDLKSKLEVGDVLDIMISNMEDCSRNASPDTLISFFNLPPSDSGDIQISEILFNPKVGGVDFLEIYNNSNKKVNLKNWSIANIDSKGLVSNISEVSSFDMVLNPSEYLAFTLNKAYLIDNYKGALGSQIKEVKKMPSYNDDAGTALLYDNNKKEFDRFIYNEKMHHVLIANVEGVSLEKTNFSSKRGNQKLWVSASEDYSFGTPGNRNSSLENDALRNAFFVEPLVFNPYQQNQSTFLHYKLNDSGVFANIEILDRNGQIKKHLKNNFSLGTEGEIEWDGKDDSNEILPVGYYVFKVNIYSEKTKNTLLLKAVLGSY